MPNPKIIIAIDGHSSTGKSTFAKMIAAKLSYVYIDTGALYRAVTFFAMEKGFIAADKKENPKISIDTTALIMALPNCNIEFKANANGKNRTFLNKKDIEKDIRTMKVSNNVSPIATIPEVRNYINILLHKMGEQKGIVMDGRDIGTAVFPNAELKIFMTASAKIRAKRRFKELQSINPNISFKTVLKNIEERDYIDSHRATAPLVRAKDSLLLDNSYMTIDDQLNWFEEIMKKYLKYE
ncbi:MAG: (d)CMP kinase [Bacteroidales bacterium]